MGSGSGGSGSGGSGGSGGEHSRAPGGGADGATLLTAAANGEDLEPSIVLRAAEIDRHSALAMLGLGVSVVYAAPVVLKLSETRASSASALARAAEEAEASNNSA